MKHPVEHLRFPEAPVEAVTEFRQVTGQVLWADTMMDTTNIAFDIGDQGLDPGQDLWRLFPRTGNEPLMVVGESSRKLYPCQPSVLTTTSSTRRALTRVCCLVWSNLLLIIMNYSILIGVNAISVIIKSKELRQKRKRFPWIL
jgi:hypothetical protein